jgi:hypothetical protein
MNKCYAKLFDISIVLYKKSKKKRGKEKIYYMHIYVWMSRWMDGWVGE